MDRLTSISLSPTPSQFSQGSSLQTKCAVKIQSAFRGFQTRKGFLPRSLYSRYAFECEHIDGKTPRALDGKTAVFLPERLPLVVLKETGLEKGRERFCKIAAFRSILQGKGWDCLVIPQVRLYKTFLVEERIFINTDPGYNANLYLLNPDLFNLAVQQFTKLFMTAGYIDYLVQKNDGDDGVLRIRYDNIPFVLQEKQGKRKMCIALIDLERSQVGSNVKSVAHRVYIIASIFPFHRNLIETELTSTFGNIGERERTVMDRAILHGKQYLQKESQDYLRRIEEQAKTSASHQKT